AGGGKPACRPRARRDARFLGHPVSESGWTAPRRGLALTRSPMADTNFPDEWLTRSLEGVLSPELSGELRTKAQPGQTLWETLVAQKIVSDDQILTALSTRFRLKLADVKDVDPSVKEKV